MAPRDLAAVGTDGGARLPPAGFPPPGARSGHCPLRDTRVAPPATSLRFREGGRGTCDSPRPDADEFRYRHAARAGRGLEELVVLVRIRPRPCVSSRDACAFTDMTKRLVSWQGRGPLEPLGGGPVIYQMKKMVF